MGELELQFYAWSIISLICLVVANYNMWIRKNYNRAIIYTTILVLIITMIVTILYVYYEVLPEIEEAKARNEEILREYYCSNNIPSTYDCFKGLNLNYINP